MVTKEQVQQLIKEAKEEYRSNPKRLKADYNAEKEYNKDYDGRQILELIQNCDDEEADEVHISLNTDQNLLSVSNSGRPFSLRGYESLMLAHLSPKLSRHQYIGNKGLGFRSLINWGNTINVYSNGFGIRFSKAARPQIFNELYDKAEQEKIRADLNLKNHIVPLPLLSIPEIVDAYPDNKYTTTVELEYHERYEDDISQQLREIEPETLVFVHNISRIILDVESDKTVLSCSRERFSTGANDVLQPYERVTIGDNRWTIYRKEEELPEDENSDKAEPDFYEIKLALKDELNDENSWLYSFFRTRIKAHFPFLIHATFDLTLDRNSLTESPKNETVVKELVSFIIDVALQLSREEVNWLPLKMLHFGLKKHNEILEELGFYDRIETAIGHEAVFPCIDGQYRTKAEVRYWSPGFSTLIQNHGWEDFFPNVVIPPDDSFSLVYFNLSSDIDELESIASKLSDLIHDINKRASLIYEFIESGSIGDFSSLFLNQNGEKLQEQQEVFSPAKQNLRIPEHCKFTIMHEDLFNALLEKFECDRAFDPTQDLLEILEDSICIKLYSISTIAHEIISQTNKLLVNGKHSPINRKKMVKDQIECLYAMGEIPSLKEAGAHVITDTGTIRKAQDVFLSDSYKTGREVISIMGKIYDEEDYVASPIVLGINDETLVKKENFLIKLGVNEYLRILRGIEVYTSSLNGDFINYFKKYRYQVEAQHKERYNERLEYASFYRFDQLRKLSPEQWISLIHYDGGKVEVITRAIEINTRVSYDLRVHSDWVNLNPTFLKYFLKQKLFKADEFLIDPPKSLYNETEINYAAQTFKRLEILKTEINHILLNLGAVEDFSSISLERVKEILEKVHNQKNAETYSQTLYKKVLEACKENDEHLGKCRLYAHSSTETKLYQNTEIFYSEKRSLPKSLRDHYPVLNLPRHSSTHDVVEYLGVNDLDEINIEVVDRYDANDCQKDFDTEWHKWKPLLLCARLKHITSESEKKRLARLLNELEITLCYSASYKAGGKLGNLSDFEYLELNQNDYLLKITERTSINKILTKQQFIDAIADILGLVFEVRDTNEFRLRLKDRDTEINYIVEEYYGQGLFQECKDLLGIATPFHTFWKPIVESKGISLYKKLDSTGLDSNFIANEFGIKEDLKSIDYIKILKGENRKVVKRLFEWADITLADYNAHSEQKLDYGKNISATIENFLRDQQDDYKNALYHHLLSENHHERSKFLSYLKKYQVGIFDFSNDVASLNINEFDLQPDIDLLKEFVKSVDVPNVDLSRDYQNIDVDEILYQRIEKLREKQTFSDEVIESIASLPTVKSLIILDAKIPFIKSEIAKHSEKSDRDSINKNGLNIIEVEKTSIVDKQIPQSKKNSLSKHSGSSKKDKIGRDSEDITKKSLIAKFGKKNIRHTSLHDDTAGYDFEYKQDGVWRYLEVKTQSFKGIHLSHNQVEFGYNNMEKYDIGIVNRDKKLLKIHKSVFSNINRSDLSPSEYIIQLSEDLTEEVDHLKI